MASEGRLLQAAISHLDLAMLNICEQSRSHELGVDDQNAMLQAALMLQELASQPKHAENNEGAEGLRGVTFALDFEVHNFEIHDQISNERLASEGSNYESHSTNRTEDMLSDKDACGLQEDETVVPTPDTESRSMQSAAASMTTPITEEGSTLKDGPGLAIEFDDLLKIMIEAYDELLKDSDKDAESGLPLWKLQNMSLRLGLKMKHVQFVCSHLERTHDGLIYKSEWRSIAKKILALHSREDMIRVIKSARTKKMHGHRITSSARLTPMLSKPLRRCLVSFRSQPRMFWDIMMTMLLLYVALALPLTLAFENFTSIQNLDRVVDWIFFCDLLLNFRTTFMNDQREEVWDAKAIAIKYLKTWFFVDFVSSFPLEQISAGLFPRLQPAKLFKIGRLTKACKMLRLSKVAKLGAVAEIMDAVEEFAWSNNLLLLRQFVMLVMQLIVMGHWFACILLACGGHSVDQYYSFQETSKWQKYLVALYWAMMTMTTVGYGDVGLTSDTERIYAIVAMMIGGSFYGYVIGVVTTILSEHDMNQRAFMERMEVVLQWLNNHHELTPQLRRRIWRHFKDFLTSAKAVEDAIILNDLPPQLCNDVSMALLKDSVRHAPLFANLSIRALSRIASAISEVKFQADEVVVNPGDAGTAMFIVDRGFAQLEDKKGNVSHLCAGDTFGEELLLCDVKNFKYTVKTHSKVCMFKLGRESFVINFRDLHQDVMTMTENYYCLLRTPDEERTMVMQAQSGRSSLLAGGPNGMTSAFPDTVLEHFTHLGQKLDNLASMHKGLDQKLAITQQALRQQAMRQLGVAMQKYASI